MATVEEIKRFFLDVNIIPTASVLDKCLELCQNYNIEAENFVDEWFAYTTSNLNGALPTIEELEKMERKERNSKVLPSIVKFGNPVFDEQRRLLNAAHLRKQLKFSQKFQGHFILRRPLLEVVEEAWLWFCVVINNAKRNPGQMKTYGRIIPDSDGKINAQSILLEGTQQLNMAHTVTLNINKVQKYALFPGQVAVVEGSNAHNGTFYAEKMFTDASPSLPVEPPNITNGK
ncbi:unnamed protein product [Brassicogethes aeneus]|uniref:Uncharacterized protein n=1 Tax=Brassicogethes aeneus TaxID=1431903 RepID=A0A9P0AY12_BRAAE|nr:unnamed protein product [Brassicogethes aeneus]